MGELTGRELRKSNAYTRFSKTSQQKHNFPPFGRYFNEKFVCTTWSEVRGELWGRKWHQSKAHSRLTQNFSIQSFAFRRLAGIQMFGQIVGCCAQSDPLFAGKGWT